jgi:hypothetical protein
MEGLGASRRRVRVALGAMISREAYEVGPEFVDRFVAADAGNAAYFTPSGREGHAMFDLPAYIAMRVERAGAGSLEDLALCTYADETRFYSYRRSVHRKEPDYGRLIAGIALV